MRSIFAGAVGGIAVASLVIQSATVAAPGDDDTLTKGQRNALAHGIQIAPKGAADQSKQVSPNPWLANLPSLEDADYFTWAKRMRAAGQKRATSPTLAAARRKATGQAALPPAFVHDEEEPAGTNGSNDSAADAERIVPFGTAATKQNRLRILGEFADLAATPTALPASPEDNGSIDLATNTGITGNQARRGTAELGDGPHGRAPGDNTNDFDFYSVDVTEGLSIVADTNGSPTDTDTVLAVYDAEGELLAADDDGGDGYMSALTFTPETPGTYYLMVAGYSFFGPLPEDPFDSGSGAGGAFKGPYRLTVGAQELDKDFYSVRLRPGDVIGGVGNGTADGLAITTPSGEQRISGKGVDASFLYPPTSPLPGGGNTTIAYVAEEAGWYAVEVTGATGSYDVLAEGYRPGAQTDRAARTQTVLLDFEGGRVPTQLWGGPGPRELSPFSAFIAKWGIPRASERALENRILATVREDIQQEIQAGGLNPAVNVRVVSTRTNPGLVGKENVSHVYVSGTIDQSGIPTIGIAQYIDPGNYGHEDSALVLLDVLSEDGDPEDAPASLNSYMNASSDRVRFVGTAVGNVIAHEVGHTVGNYHTDYSDDVHNLMDEGGGFFAENLYGVGPDRIGGTADDPNLKFETDTYSLFEGFLGEEDTQNVIAWAYSGR